MGDNLLEISYIVFNPICVFGHVILDVVSHYCNSVTDMVWLHLYHKYGKLIYCHIPELARNCCKDNFIGSQRKEKALTQKYAFLIEGALQAVYTVYSKSSQGDFD